MKIRVRKRPRVVPLPEEFEALLWILNATGEQVKQWADGLPQCEGYDPYVGWGLMPDHKDPEWGDSSKLGQEKIAGLLRTIAADLTAGHPPAVTANQRWALERYAEHPTELFVWEEGKPPRIAQVPTNTRRLNLAVRGLWRILAGEAELHRCPAPKPFGWPSDRCNKYFVTGATRGNPARYCSDTCRARDFRRRKAREEREAEASHNDIQD